MYKMNVSLWVFFFNLSRRLILLTKPSITQNSPWILGSLLSPETNEGQAEGTVSDTSLPPCVAMLASGGAGLWVKG